MMETKDIISIVAIVAGPLFAVLITLRYQIRREKRQAKLDIFHTLIAHRGEIPIPRHFVAALNKIVIVFHKNHKVLSAWKAYFENLKGIGMPNNREGLFADLLDEMAKDCGYKGLKQTIYLDSYMPNQFGYESTRANEFHTELIKFLKAHQNPAQPVIVDGQTL